MNLQREQNSVEQQVANAQSASGADNSSGATATKNDNSGGDDSFFTIPDNIQSQLSHEARNLMNQTGKSWLAKYTRKRQEETQQLRDMEARLSQVQHKAEQLDSLMSDPVTSNLLIQAYNQMQGGTIPSAQNNSNDDGMFENFENGGEVKALADRIENRVVDRLSDMINPVVQSLAVNREQSEIDQVKGFVAQQKATGNILPPVDENSVRMAMRKHNVSAMNAYRMTAADSLMSNNTPLIEDLPRDLGQLAQQQDQGGNGQQASQSSKAMLEPGAGSTQDIDVLPSRLTVDDKLNQAKKLRGEKADEQTVRQEEMNTQKVLGDVLKDYNVKSGGGYTLKDL